LLSSGLLNFFNTLVKRDEFDLVADLRREDLRRGHHHGCCLDEDVTPDLLAEAVVISVDESEERDVVTCDLGGFHLNGNVDFLTRLHYLQDALRRSLEVIPICLNKEGVFRPVEFASISESPCLDELLSSEERESITEAFFDESSLVNGLLLLRLFVAFSWLLRRCLARGKVALLTHLVRVLAMDHSRGVLGLSDLEERVLVDFLNFASVTEVKVGAGTALVADTLDRADAATVAGNSIVGLRGLLGSSLAKMIYHQSLESLSGIGLDFLLDNLDKISVELVLEGTGAIASSAGHALLVDFGAITLEANDAFIICNSLFLILGAENLAVNFLRDSLSLELASLALSLDGAIAEGLADILESLRAAILGVNDSVKLLLVSLHRVSVAPEILDIDIVSGSLSVDSLWSCNHEWALSSHCNAMCGLLFLISANILKLLADAIVITTLKVTWACVRDAWNRVKGVLELIHCTMNEVGIDARLRGLEGHVEA